MSKSKKSQPHPSYNPLDDDALHLEPEGNHPSDVSGIFKDDPTFEEFCEILRQQREEDYQQVNEEIDELIRKEEEAKECSSSTPTPSHTTNTTTTSSPQK